MYAYPQYPDRESCLLDGFWEFAFLGDDVPSLPDISASGIRYDEIMAVPGCFDAAPKYAGRRGVGAYRRQLHVRPETSYRLTFHGLGLAGRALLDGREVLSDRCPWSKMSVEFRSGATRTMELVVLIDNRLTPPSTPLFRPNYDFYGYGGIYRSVELERLPDGPRLDRAKVETLSLDGRVRVTGRVCGGPGELFAAFDDGELLPVAAEFQGEEFTFEAAVPSPRLWSPEHPELHTLTLRCADDRIVECFGLRTVAARDGKILLNDRPIRLVGYNRHDAHPQFGPAMPDQLWIEDLQILKDLNCNFIRGCHYPQSQRFLDLCDRMGFLVWEESLGWGNRNDSVTDEEFIRLQIRQTENMVRQSANHPSVILWGMMNESNDHEEAGAKLLHTLTEVIRKNDRTRLVTNASMFIRDSLALKDMDVISFNSYPAWYEADNPSDPRPLARIGAVLDEIVAKLDRDGWTDKPLIVSEIGAGALYGCHDRIRGFWSEEYQADYLGVAADYFRDHPRLSGLALWHFADARTYAATSGILGRPRGFNNKGTLDEYRRPKLAYDVVREKFAEIREKQPEA